ncbi:phosphatase PAP2 family protein [Clostridium magnum]|uniref:Undecaprenyl-diphosphatase BcrC n=1 Tax=Clostridium magnum DSM 2767 TaxID=1121326 RepID=A0A162TGX9_9CLOT|nr:phosphatase PAP2 family protein [Clostridium magnum]KZL92625.1 undecaprenyl-diphosphatase BcrC [Clostridium magnum DSM 2767]SHI24090.1 undecaprenyl-diphosphatase [Clostridium magnum DSM 2767]
MNINELLFKSINGLAHQSVLLDNIMIILSKYVPGIFMASLAIFYTLGVLNKNKKIRGITVDTFVITVINLALSFIIGIIYYVPRPFVQQKVNLLFPHVIDASFPSDHAIGTMSIAIGINKYQKLSGRILIILSVLVGISRVYVGHHFPIDVIGGYVIVLATNYLYHQLIKDRVQNIYFKVEEMLVGYIPTKVKEKLSKQSNSIEQRE